MTKKTGESSRPAVARGKAKKEPDYKKQEEANILQKAKQGVKELKKSVKKARKKGTSWVREANLIQKKKEHKKRLQEVDKSLKRGQFSLKEDKPFRPSEEKKYKRTSKA